MTYHFAVVHPIVDEVAWAKNRTKSKVRAKVEHVFQVMKLERASVVCHLRSGQPVCQSQQTAAGGVISVPHRMTKGSQKAFETSSRVSRVTPEAAFPQL
jgi:hypothetical protein